MQTPTSLTLTEIYLSSTTFTDQVTFIGFSGTATTLPRGLLPRPDISTTVQLPQGPLPVLKVTTVEDMANMIVGINTTNMTNRINRINPLPTLTKSVFKRRNSPPSQSRLTPLTNNPSISNNLTTKARRRIHATLQDTAILHSQARPKINTLSYRSDRDGTLQEGEIYLSNLETSHEEWIFQVQFSLHHRSRVKAACELPEDKRPQPLRKVNKSSFDSVTRALNNVADGIPSHKVQLFVHVLAGAGLLEHINLGGSPYRQEKCSGDSGTRPAKIQTSPTLRGTSVTAAQCILLEGLIRPADWTCNPDLKQSQLPTFGAYALRMEIARADNKVPQWAAVDLLDRASKKGKGQLPVIIGALYKGSEAHLGLALLKSTL